MPSPPHFETDVLIIGAGPIGIELAIALKRAGIDYLHLDKGQVGQTITWYPRHVTFFSSNDRIALAGLPIQTVGQSKASREQYLAYLRQLVQQYDLNIHTHHPVWAVRRQEDDTFLVHAHPAAGERIYRCNRVVFVTGDMHRPRLIDIPGEDLPHVSHYFTEPHDFFRKRLLIVGGRNSAVEAALRCYHAGADVTISYRADQFDASSVKYWLLPELQGRIKRGEIDCHLRTRPVRITPTHTLLESVDHPDAGPSEVEADFVLLLTGYVADMSLLQSAGVELADRTQTPHFDEQTMETNVPGIYVAGTATAGTQQRYRVFIENCHVHVDRIVADLTGAAPPTPATASTAQLLPES